jgi:hypothetical protein
MTANLFTKETRRRFKSGHGRDSTRFAFVFGSFSCYSEKRGESVKGLRDLFSMITRVAVRGYDEEESANKQPRFTFPALLFKHFTPICDALLLSLLCAIPKPMKRNLSRIHSHRPGSHSSLCCRCRKHYGFGMLK